MSDADGGSAMSALSRHEFTIAYTGRNREDDHSLDGVRPVSTGHGRWPGGPRDGPMSDAFSKYARIESGHAGRGLWRYRTLSEP